MAFLSREQTEALGFRELGQNVFISDKASIHNADQIQIGDNSRVDDFCVLSGKITIGRNVHIAVFCNLAGGNEGITLSDFSGLAYGCHVFSQSDDYSGETMTNPTVPDRYKRETKKAVHIGRHCIVGTNSLILPGVHLAEGCAIGAMSMVTKSTEEWMIYIGCPARPWLARKRELLALERAYIGSEEQS